MRRHRRVKIVATLGPASESAEVIHALFEAGADVFRLNFSHGAHAEHAARVRTIRTLERETGRVEQAWDLLESVFVRVFGVDRLAG